jgi:hypothetical protein
VKGLFSSIAAASTMAALAAYALARFVIIPKLKAKVR